jgi:hypothetical protein
MIQRGMERQARTDEANVAQAEVFHAFLAEQRAELCDRLDEQAANLERLTGDYSYGAKLKRRRIKEIGTEIREVDRMMHELRIRLLRSEPEPIRPRR